MLREWQHLVSFTVLLACLFGGPVLSVETLEDILILILFYFIIFVPESCHWNHDFSVHMSFFHLQGESSQIFPFLAPGQGLKTQCCSAN